MTSLLSPGKWTSVDVVLPETTPAQLGYLRIKLSVDDVVFLGVR